MQLLATYLHARIGPGVLRQLTRTYLRTSGSDPPDLNPRQFGSRQGYVLPNNEPVMLVDGAPGADPVGIQSTDGRGRRQGALGTVGAGHSGLRKCSVIARSYAVSNGPGATVVNIGSHCNRFVGRCPEAAGASARGVGTARAGVVDRTGTVHTSPRGHAQLRAVSGELNNTQPICAAAA